MIVSHSSTVISTQVPTLMLLRSANAHVIAHISIALVHAMPSHTDIVGAHMHGQLMLGGFGLVAIILCRNVLLIATV